MIVNEADTTVFIPHIRQLYSAKHMEGVPTVVNLPRADYKGRTGIDMTVLHTCMV